MELYVASTTDAVVVSTTTSETLSPKSISKVLRTLERIDGVVEAHAWESKGTLLARVVVNDSTYLSEMDVRQACSKKIGADLTPKIILLERKQRQAA